MNIRAEPLVAAVTDSLSASGTGAQARLRIRVNDRDLHLPSSALAGVADCPALARVPLGPSWLLGVGGLNGRLLPVVDLAAAENESVSPSAPGPHVLLVQIRGHLVGFSVSHVSVEPGDPTSMDTPDFAIRRLAERLLNSAGTASRNPIPSG